MTESENKLVYTANIQRAFVCTVMWALHTYIANMVNYCKANNITISSFEKSQLNIIDRAIRNITIDYRQLNNGRSEAFKRYANILAITVQELFSRTDGDYMTMFKFYNYVKAFPTTCKEIEPTANEEKDAFSVIFNGDNSNNG